MKQLVVLLPSSELGVLTPFYTMHPDSMVMDKMEGWIMALMKDEIAGYILEVRDIVQPFGPSIINSVEVLGDLNEPDPQTSEGEG